LNPQLLTSEPCYGGVAEKFQLDIRESPLSSAHLEAVMSLISPEQAYVQRSIHSSINPIKSRLQSRADFAPQMQSGLFDLENGRVTEREALEATVRGWPPRSRHKTGFEGLLAGDPLALQPDPRLWVLAVARTRARVVNTASWHR